MSRVSNSEAKQYLAWCKKHNEKPSKNAICKYLNQGLPGPKLKNK